MYYVYWIKKINHQDPFTEGYVGITNNIKKRFTSHRSSKASNNSILLRAINKGASVYELHRVSSKEEALALEEKYRPSEKIGWNINKGGSCPPSQTGKKFGKFHGFIGGHHSEAHKQKMSNLIKNLKWYNNGTLNVRATSCPEGFVEGRLRFKTYCLSEAGKKNIGRAGKKISTPYGVFNTIRAAASKIGIHERKVGYKVHSKKHKDWFIVND